MANSENELPLGWTTCTLREVTLPVSRIDPKDDPAQRIDYIDISAIDNVLNVVGSAKNYRVSDAPSRARQIVNGGDILFATVRPYLCNIARVPIKYHQQIASTGFSVLRAAKGIVPDFLFYKAISRDFVDALARVQYGVSYPAVKDEHVRDQVLFLPPTAEQRRIVAKLEGLFSELDNGVAMLKTAREQLGTYRQAVLKHAFEGKLTSHWREGNTDKLETAEQVLFRINRQRAARYDQQIRDWKDVVQARQAGERSRKRPARPRHAREMAQASVSTVDGLPRLPYGWQWVRLDSIAEVSGGLTKNQKRHDLPRKMKYLRVANVYADKILIDDVREIGVTAEESRSVALEAGDLLIVEGNGSIEQIGRVAMWRGELPACGHQNHLIRVRLAIESDPRLVLQFLLSPIGRDLIVKEASSTSGLHTLSISKVESLFVPVGSAAEESEVVFRVDAELSRIDKVVDEIKSQLAKSTVLRQSILKKAFSGELVPQDRCDEPASVLLDRIKAEREQVTKRRTPRKTGR